MPSTTRKTIRREIHDRLYAQNRGWRKLRRGPDVTGLTEFTTAMTSITDTAFQEVMHIGNEFIGGWLRLMYVDNASANQERVSRITQFNPAAGTVVFSPAIGTVHGTAANVNGEYEIWPDVHPEAADDAINRILSDIRPRVLIPLTLITDGDMDATGTTDYTASGATLAKNTNAVYVLHRTQSLQVSASAAKGHAQSTALYIPPSTTLFCSTDVFIFGGAFTDEARLILYDVLNATELEEGYSDFNGWVNLSFTKTTKSNSEVIRLNLEGRKNSDVAYFDNAIVLPTEQNIFDLPSTLEFASDLGRVISFPRGAPLGGSANKNAYKILERETQDWGSFRILRDDTADHPLRVELSRQPIDAPLLLDARVTASTLSADASTTVTDRDTVVEGALFYIEKARGNKTEAERHLRMFNRLMEINSFGPRVWSSYNRERVAMN